MYRKNLVKLIFLCFFASLLISNNVYAISVSNFDILSGQRMYVYAKRGETINFESSVLEAQLNNNYEIKVVFPNGDVHLYNNSLKIAVEDTGIYTFIFNFQDKINVWNITVEENNVEKKGRMWSKCWKISSNNEYQVFYLLTQDGYVYPVNLGEVNNDEFFILGNNRGIVDGNTNTPLYMPTGNFGENIQFHKPYDSDTKLDKAYKIFLEEPSPELPEYIKKEAYKPDPIINISFKGINANDNEGYVGEGGYFNFYVSNATSYEIKLNFTALNGKVQAVNRYNQKIYKDSMGNEVALLDSEYNENLNQYTPVYINGIVYLRNTCIDGINSAYWDGKDEYGHYLPQGVYGGEEPGLTIETVAKVGEYHFLTYEEQNNSVKDTWSYEKNESIANIKEFSLKEEVNGEKGTIKGKVYFDIDRSAGNMNLTNGDYAIDGAKIELYAKTLNDLGEYDYTFIKSTKTDLLGNYIFGGLDITDDTDFSYEIRAVKPNNEAICTTNNEVITDILISYNQNNVELIDVKNADIGFCWENDNVKETNVIIEKNDTAEQVSEVEEIKEDEEVKEPIIEERVQENVNENIIQETGKLGVDSNVRAFLIILVIITIVAMMYYIYTKRKK